MIRSREGLKIARFMMVLSSISPLFIFWAVKGNSLIPDNYFVTACIIMVFLPNLFLFFRIKTAKKLREIRSITIGRADDHRDHLLVYLFAMLLPFYAADFSSFRALAAHLSALAFVIFIFWHLNLHYMNIIFASLGYHVFTVYPIQNGNTITGRGSRVLISKRIMIYEGEVINAYRISDTVYFEGVGI